MKLVLIEPGLIGTCGHPIEFTQSLFLFAQEIGIDVYIVSNRKTLPEVKTLFGDRLLPLITNTCFAELESRGLIYKNDLKELDRKLHLTSNDVVVNLSSYTNELCGISLFVRESLKENLPRLHYWVHQLFPPEADFVEAAKPERQCYWLNRFENECNNLPENISVYSTGSERLRKKLTEIIKKDISVLPLPYDASFFNLNKKVQPTVDFAFIGDGRYEKGLLLFVEATEKLLNMGLKFMVQDANLRGYSGISLQRFNEAFHFLRLQGNFKVINKQLPRADFYEAIASSKFMVFPYHPLSYDMRISGLLVQSTLMGIPSIVSSGTWLEEEVSKINSGIVFNYDPSSEKNTMNDLVRSIKEANLNYMCHKQTLNKSLSFYRATHSPEGFLKKLQVI